MRNHAEGHWKRHPQYKANRIAMQRHICDSLIGFWVCWWCLHVVLGCVREFGCDWHGQRFCRIDRQSMYSGVTSKDPLLRVLLRMVSERLCVFVVLIPLRGVYSACIGRILAVRVYFGNTAGASYTYHMMGVHYAHSGRKQGSYYSV